MDDDDELEPAPFVKIKSRRRYFGKPFDAKESGNSAGCTGKMAFASAPQALKAIRHKTNIDGRRAYRCPICRQWHIGNQFPTK